MEAFLAWAEANQVLSLGLLVFAFVLLLIVWANVQARRELAEAKKQGIKLHPHIHAPVKNGQSTFFDRASPLLYEETKNGKWKLSLGRVAFWSTQAAFIGMCMAVVASLKDEHQVDGNLVTLYISVITMLFLTNLGLLAYNLGAKFTEPMKDFISSWGAKSNVSNILDSARITHAGQPTPEEAPHQRADRGG